MKANNNALIAIYFCCFLFFSLCAFRVRASTTIPVIESSDLQLILRKDLSGIAHLTDKKTGRDYTSTSSSTFGLYSLYLGRNPKQALKISSTDAAEKKLKQIERGVELLFRHNDPHKIEVLCQIRAIPDRAGIRWNITVKNHTSIPITSIEYPINKYTSRLGNSFEDDTILLPEMEGQLLCKPYKFITSDKRFGSRYPGITSSQLMYYYDDEGGLYIGAHDTTGFPKTPIVERIHDDFSITWEHLFPSELLPELALPYDIVMQSGGNSWQHGADIYREWAERQAPWCRQKISGRNVADWLQEVNVFLNYGFSVNGPFFPAEKAAENLEKYRKYLDAPIVACIFGWEKNGTWIGPDYFPPRGGEDYYRTLGDRLVKKGNHLQVFTSGFRWGIRKPKVEQWDKSKSRIYTDWDGNANFKNLGIDAAALNPEGRLIFEKQPWADNYILCVGSEKSRKIISNSFFRIYDMGIHGVDLDQNIGAGVSDCYSTQHNHALGRGLWQYKAMRIFLSNVRTQTKSISPDCFIGVEEPCETYIPWIDIVHGRAFTDTRWPVHNPGTISVPLNTYLYHEYQLNYAGWIDPGFSPLNNVRIGIGRAFIFGMQLGVRINNDTFSLHDGPPSQEMIMLRKAVRVLKRTAPNLLEGRMMHDPKIIGSPFIKTSEFEFNKGKRPWPIKWPAVQTTAWRSLQGSVCYAIVNLSENSQRIYLEVVLNGLKDGFFKLVRIGPDSEQVLKAKVKLPTRVKLILEPWEICCVMQTLLK